MTSRSIWTLSCQSLQISLRNVITAIFNHELVVGADARFQPVEQPMLGDRALLLSSRPERRHKV